MSHPFIIWTMQRTGGTTLAGLLSTLSEHPGIQHEPFNHERRWGSISDAFTTTQDETALRADIDQVLKPLPVIKHCYELHADALNRNLLEVATARGYRHIILDRRAEVDRILSLELAKITGAWGSDEAKEIYLAIEAGEKQISPIDMAHATRHMHVCLVRRKVLAKMFDEAGQKPFVVYFEDIYGKPRDGRVQIRQVVDFVGIKPDNHPRYKKMVNDALLLRGQNTARIMGAVPNMDEARQRLETVFAEGDFAFQAL